MESKDGSRSLTINHDPVVVQWARHCCALGRRYLWVVATVLWLTGCQTDHAKQDAINQIRAEKLAAEDRYIALRHEYEKLRNRMAAQGDPEAKSPQYPSALPLIYPPGPSPLDLVPASQAAWHVDSDEDFSPQQLANRPDESRSRVPALQQRPQRLEVRLLQWEDRIDNSPQRLRIVVRPVDQQGRACSPLGTYTLRLTDPTRIGDGSELGSWNFPAESIRRFFAGRPTDEQAEGMPLQASFQRNTKLPPQVLAEIEFYPLVGSKISGREIANVYTSNQPTPSLQDWAATLPLPHGTQGLMSNIPTEPPQASLPTWRPDR